MGYLIKKIATKYTYGDYIHWPEGERWELIDGEAYNMTPAPSRMHQDITGELFYQIKTYLKDKTCKVYMAPFDVRLPKGKEKREEDIDTVVQPDIVIVCDKSKLDDKGCSGAPDLVIEILSPFTAAKDYREKFALYEKSKVLEYWIVHPTDKIVTVYLLQESGVYGKGVIYSGEEEITVGIFKEGLLIDLKAVFRE